MSAGGALRAALVSAYHHSWRLVVLNSLLSAAVIAVLFAASHVQLALLLGLLVGPLVAALAHCAVTLVETEELRLRDAVAGLRLHWLRGLELGFVTAAVVGFGLFALVFYARAGGLALPLAVLAGYLLVLFGAFQLVLWPLAVKHRDRGLRAIVREAGSAMLRRPLPTLALALALAVVNALGVAAAVLPLLTFTVAYSFVAAAHFSLPTVAIDEETG